MKYIIEIGRIHLQANVRIVDNIVTITAHKIENPFRRTSEHIHIYHKLKSLQLKKSRSLNEINFKRIQIPKSVLFSVMCNQSS